MSRAWAAVGVLVALIALPGLAGAADPPDRRTDLPDKTRSYSLKNASDGYLVRGVRMPSKSRTHEVLLPTRRRGYQWGTQELVAALKRAARIVAKKYPGSVLQIANMSREGGGDITPSVSHNSGRDADLSFYVMDSRGRPVQRDGFTRFDAKGRAGDLRFDARRNWALVRALLEDESIQLQWMFCSSSLRALLLKYARRAKEPAWLIDRAAQVLGQPGNSSPHAEHFHVRIYCGLHERLEGCLNYGTMHPWVDDWADDVDARARQLAIGLTSQDEAAAVRAAQRIGDIRGSAALDALGLALSDERLAVRLAVADTIELLEGNTTVVPQLLAALTAAQNPSWVHRITETLARIGDVRSADAFGMILENPDRRPATRALAAVGLGQMLHRASVPALIRACADSQREVRHAAADALLRITNHSFGTGARAVKRGLAWWQANQARSRLDWIRDGFAAVGVKEGRKRSVRFFRKLLRHIRAGGPRSFNARTLIAALTGYSIRQGHFSDFQMFRFYRSWIRGGGWKKLPEPPAPATP